MQINILVVDDEERIRNLLEAYLRKEGYRVFLAESGYDAVEVFKGEDIHLVILDIMMPGIDGIMTLELMRKHKNIPTIMLTAKAEEEDMLSAFNVGADQYETKPFSPKVLMAKVRAIINREYSKADDITIDEDGYNVAVYGKEVQLSKTEFDLLLYLSKNPNRVLTRDMILDKVWGYDFDGDIRVVDTGIKRLREKLLEKSSSIVTVRGVGYKYENK